MDNLDKFHVSVIMPLYNTEKYVKEAIDSLLVQSLLPLEIIVIDDCSTDSSYEIVKEIADTNNLIKLFKLSKNMGVSAARNYGINLAVGNWILFLDADDIVTPKLIEKMLERLKCLSQMNMNKWLLAYSAFQQIDNSGNPLGIIYGAQRELDEIFGYELIRNDIISPSGVMIHKQSTKNVGGFDEGIKYSEDWDLWLKVAQIGGFAYIDSPLVKIRRHNENTSKKMDVMLKAELNVLKKYDLPSIKEAIFKRKLSREKNGIDFVSILFRLNKWEEGNQTLNQMIKNYQKTPSIYFYKGLYHLKCNQLNKAMENFELVLCLNPQHGAALNNLGAILAVKNEISKSKEFFQRALSNYKGYMDAQKNYDKLKQYSGGFRFTLNDIQITWRELRPTLLIYSD